MGNLMSPDKDCGNFVVDRKGGFLRDPDPETNSKKSHPGIPKMFGSKKPTKFLLNFQG